MRKPLRSQASRSAIVGSESLGSPSLSSGTAPPIEDGSAFGGLAVRSGAAFVGDGEGIGGRVDSARATDGKASATTSTVEKVVCLSWSGTATKRADLQ